MSGANNLCWVNGVPGAALDPLDRGLHYGDGLFETIQIRDSQPRFLAEHLRRLGEGCERLRLVGVDGVALAQELRQVAALAASGILKLIVTRGPAVRRGYDPAGCATPTRIITLTPGLPARSASARVGYSDVHLAENPRLAGLKHLNRLENVLARASCPPNLDEVLMSTESGQVVCGSMSNVFAVVGGVLLTPAVDRCGVAGVLRAVVLREAATLGFDVQVKPLRPAELSVASEIFVSNARVGVWPLSELAGQPVPVGPVSRALQTHVDALR